MHMLYKYKEAFSLRDKIGTCPNIEVEIYVTEIRYRKRNYLGILKERFSAYSSPVMLISRKVTQDKRVVTGF